MSASQMADRCPGAQALGPVRLDGFALAFDRWSERRGGYVADVVPAAAGAVWGVLWRVTDEHLQALDRHEGVAAGAYRREDVRVAASEGILEAVAYRVCQPVFEGPPAPTYLQLLLDGGREHGLPAGYLAQVEAGVSALGAMSRDG